MVARPLQLLSLCSGIGGLDLGVQLASGGRTVCYCERESFAATVLVARMEDQAVDPGPIWDDISTFDGRRWRGKVDAIVAGFPCQPVSQAGERNADKDERWIWPEIVRVVREVGPGLLFLENVAGIFSLGIGSVLGDLAELGFDAEWAMLPARAVGAPHQRRRWFAVAYAGRECVKRWGESRGLAQARYEAEREAQKRERGGHSVDSRGGQLANTDRARLEGFDVSKHGCSGQRFPWTGGGGLEIFPPRPNEPERWAEILRKWPEVEPAVHGVANGVSGRLDRLAKLGNGVVPLQAAVAYDLLFKRLSRDLFGID